MRRRRTTQRRVWHGQVSPEQAAREARQAILRRYARIQDGQPVLCRHSAGKVTYDVWESAETARLELQAMGGRPMETYRCARSDHYHHKTASATT